MELSQLSDFQLVTKIKDSADSDAYLELKKRVEKCYYKTCERFCKKVPLLRYHELMEDCDFLINKSIQTFNPKKKTKFSSWVTNYSKYHVLNTIKNLTEVGHFIPTENKDIDFHNEEKKNFHLDNNEDLKEHVFNLIGNMKDRERIRKIFELRFYGTAPERKWRHISSILKITPQQCSNIFNSAKSEIYKKMVKEEYNR